MTERVSRGKGKVALRSYTNLLNRINPPPPLLRRLLSSLFRTRRQISATFIDHAKQRLPALQRLAAAINLTIDMIIAKALLRRGENPSNRAKSR
jgi:hypothetical protein